MPYQTAYYTDAHFYSQMKVVYGEELHLKPNKPWRTLKHWLQAQENASHCVRVTGCHMMKMAQEASLLPQLWEVWGWARTFSLKNANAQ